MKRENDMAVKKQTIKVTTTGSAGSATGTTTWTRGRPGIVRFVKFDFHASAPATTDVTIKADSSTGQTLFTVTNSATDIDPKPVGMPGVDEGNAALAATDASSGGFPFSTGLYVSVAQSDALTDAVQVDVWYDA